MKRLKIFSGFTVAAIAAAMLAAMPASAANYAANKQATGGTTQIQKYLVIDNNAQVPDATFEYEITAGTAVNYTTPEGATGTVAAYAGIGVDKIDVGDVSFEAADIDDAVPGAENDGITNSEDKKYVKKSFELDFSEVKFPEPGVYRYVLTEKNAGDEDDLGLGIKHVGNYQKTLDVYVTDSNGTLSVSTYVLCNSVRSTRPQIADEVAALEDDVDRTATNNTDKTDGFVNEYVTKNLSFAKKVTGNQGSKDKYFKFSVKIKDAEGTIVTVDLAGAEAAPTANNATIYTQAVMAAANAVDENGDADDGQQLVIDSDEKTYYFYLQNGQYITLKGLPTGASYEVSEAAEEYTSTVTDDDENSIEIGTLTFKDDASGDIGDDDIATGFINNKNGSIPTGVILSIAGPAVIGLAVVGGIIYMTIKRKKEDAED